jgi:hypothetical protein
MRCVACLMLLLGGIIWCAARIDPGESIGTPPRVVDSPWRRTKDGWQRADGWPGSALRVEPIESLGAFDIDRVSLPHPLIVGLMQLSASLFFLLAFAPNAKIDPPAAHEVTLNGE